MHIVIKHTRTVEEYTAKRKELESLANRCADTHSLSVEEWTEGEPVKGWQDVDGNICVEYASGAWWHYKWTPEGLQWW